MPKILEVLRPEDKVSGFGIEGDIRPSIISDIKVIEAFKVEPPSVIRDRNLAVITAAKRLRLAIRGMPERAALDALAERCVKDSEQKVEAIAPKGKLDRRSGDAPNTQQNLLAARLVYDLLLDNGFGVPTLDSDGQYVRLTALVIKAATGRLCNRAMAGKACSLHFKDLQAERLEGLSEDEQTKELKQDPWPYSRRGRRPRVMLSSDEEALCRRRLEASRHYLPLEQLLDEML
jgi:hypothetical protein